MNHNNSMLWYMFYAGLIFICSFIQGQDNAFIVKKKPKKESCTMIKEDIADQLEFQLRQINKTIAELSQVQEQIFNAMKDLAGLSNSTSLFSDSVEQLSKQRSQLKIYSENLSRCRHEIKLFKDCF